MNKSYNIVWSVARNAFVVAPEFSTSDGCPATRVRAVAAALLLALASPAALAYTENVTDGMTVAGETIEASQKQNISQGGVANATTVNTGGTQHVSASGTAADTTLNSGGILEVDANGTATGIVQNSGGALIVNTDVANVVGTNANGTQFTISGGQASNVLLENGGSLRVFNGDTATNTTVNHDGDLYVSSGGKAINTLVSRGVQNIYTGGSSYNTDVNNGWERVYGGGTATDTTVNARGIQQVWADGMAIGTTINSGGKLETQAGSTATGIVQNSGGALITNTDVANVEGVNVNGAFTISGGQANNVLLENGGVLDVYVGDTATDSVANSGGTVNVSSGGTTLNTTINNKGLQQVYGGGTATDTTVNSGGVLDIDADGTATGIVQNSGGALVTNTDVANVEGVNTNGAFTISGGQANNVLLENGGILDIYAGDTATGSIANSGGNVNVSSGGTATDTTVNANGALNVSSGATAIGTTVNNGGTLWLDATGTVLDGETLIMTGAALEAQGAIVNQGELNFNLDENATRTVDNVIQGDGSLKKTGEGSLTLTGNNTYQGGTTISDGTLNVESLTALSNGDVNNFGILNLNAAGEYELANVTTYAGGVTTLSADTTIHAAAFNQQDDSVLNINLDADVDTPVITADSVSLSGTLNITGIGNVADPLKHDPYAFTLIDSDSAITDDFDDLTIAGVDAKQTDFLTVDGRVNPDDNTQYQLAASLSWYADRDNAASNAHGTFTLSDADGSFNLATDLVDVDDTLDPASTTGWDGKTLTKEGAGELILSGNNTYSGGTLINDGTLTAASVNALGTGLVDNHATLVLDANGTVNAAGGITTETGATTLLAAGTSLDLGAGSLTQQSGSTLNIELNRTSKQPLITGASASLDGSLVVNDVQLQDISSDEQLGSFTLMDMDNEISGDFTSMSMNLTNAPDYLTVNAGINPDDGSQYLLSETLSWNAGDVSATAAHGTFTLAAGKTFEVTSVLADQTGNADWDGKTLTKQGDGTLILSGDNTYSGNTDVQDGTLWLTGTINGAGDVNIADSATFIGSGDAMVGGDVNNSGTLNFGDSTQTNATFTINGDLTNAGTLSSGSSTPGNTLYVGGNYTGDNGRLYLNTELGGDDSTTDKLVVAGDTSGNTTLHINGIGDTGAQTVNGIEVVDIGGESNGVFTQENQVQAGLYEYRLYKHEDDGDWYLESASSDDGGDSGDDSGDHSGGDSGGDSGDHSGGDSGGDVTPATPQYRADIGAYLGNQWMARNSQMQTLYDREDSQYRSANGNLWARFKAGKTESQAVDGNVDMDSNYSQFQLGGDILAWDNGQQSFTVGVMGSYINADTDSTGNRGADGSRFSASGSMDGYNLGLYATWFADAQTHSGAYIDSWYQYGTYNNDVDNGDVGSESYDSTANAVSLETGYRYDIALTNGNTVSLTPQAQVIWQNYDADSVTDNNGTRIDGQDSDSWTTRLGLRVDGKLYKDERAVIQPFVEANWLHTSDDTEVSFDGADVKQDIPGNRAELKVGLQTDIDKQWSIRAQVAGQTGSDDYSDLNGSLNLRYNW
ncbi:autotransporter outer membrane beta-barrel domain-containing protein [Salmonella enterica]